jgi:DNA adenine methylase
MIAKPFVKWAGGKTQLIDQIKDQLPDVVFRDKFTYIEPFVGGGAILFFMLENFPNMEKAVINDINKDLADSYQTIKDDVDNLITLLYSYEQQYNNLPANLEAKKEYYYAKRETFNKRNSTTTAQSALLIFLNKTCFNGLYRVNKSNGFNVPIGSYMTPTICFEDNLKAISKALQKVEILNGDYSETLSKAGDNTLFYLDPPYKPLSDTSSFNSYAKDEFGDSEQIRLKEFCETLDKANHSWILSNSDVKGKNPDNNFFDDLYADYTIQRVDARRNINANPTKRGKLKELLITN